MPPVLYASSADDADATAAQGRRGPVESSDRAADPDRLGDSERRYVVWRLGARGEEMDMSLDADWVGILNWIIEVIEPSGPMTQ